MRLSENMFVSVSVYVCERGVLGSEDIMCVNECVCVCLCV